MQATIRRAGDITVFHLAGEFNGDTDCAQATVRLKELLDQGARMIVLDFTHVRWINSNGIGCLIAGKKLADAAGARMALCHLNRRSLSVFHTMRLEEIFSCEADLEAAFNTVISGRRNKPRPPADAGAGKPGPEDRKSSKRT
jgi:anti-sigma B factor antagonist